MACKIQSAVTLDSNILSIIGLWEGSSMRSSTTNCLNRVYRRAEEKLRIAVIADWFIHYLLHLISLNNEYVIYGQQCEGGLYGGLHDGSVIHIRDMFNH